MTETVVVQILDTGSVNTRMEDSYMHLYTYMYLTTIYPGFIEIIYIQD